MPQHALRSKYHQWLAPAAQRLPAQQLKILRGVRRLADLNVVLGGELQIAFDASARMLRTLALVAVRQQQHDARGEIPLIFSRADELVDDHLRAVGKISELRLPKHKRLGIIPAIAVFEA